MRTYIPTGVIENHKLALFLTRYAVPLRAAIVLIDPDYGAVFDALLEATVAFDAISAALYPLVD